METVFIDESGSPILSHKVYREGYATKLGKALNGKGPFPPYPFFVLAAVALPITKYRIVERWFMGMKKSYLKASLEHHGQQYEIKGSMLYTLLNGKKPREWTQKGRQRRYSRAQAKVWGQLDQRQLRSLERSAFDLLTRIRPKIWAVVVKQERLYSKHGDRTWNPVHYALTYLQQRICQHMEATYGSHGLSMLVMDETSTLSTAAQFDDFLVTRRRINATASWPVDFDESMVHIPLAAPSHLVGPLQLADLVAHAVYRHLRSKDSRDWFSRLEPHFARHWTTGEISNAGLTIIE